MGNLREQIEADLAETLEGDYGLPVILIAPDGEVIDTNANDPTKSLMGQVLYDTLVENPDTGGELIVHKPVVTLRRSSLSRVPLANEKWAVKIPTTPSASATTTTFIIQRPSEDGGAIGFIRLYLMRAEQT